MVLPWLPADESNEIQGLGVDEDDGDELMLTFEEMLVAESGSDSLQSLVSSTDASALCRSKVKAFTLTTTYSTKVVGFISRPSAAS
jgi:hypothetical protein